LGVARCCLFFCSIVGVWAGTLVGSSGFSVNFVAWNRRVWGFCCWGDECGGESVLARARESVNVHSG
jgi:hypothetical protein